MIIYDRLCNFLDQLLYKQYTDITLECLIRKEVFMVSILKNILYNSDTGPLESAL
jgi:hypothetical protein